MAANFIVQKWVDFRYNVSRPRFALVQWSTTTLDDDYANTAHNFGGDHNSASVRQFEAVSGALFLSLLAARLSFPFGMVQKEVEKITSLSC